MSERISFEELTFEPLSDVNVPQEFDCGDEDLNDFILNDALTHQENHVAVTTLVRYEDDLVGFFSLAADCISLELQEAEKTGIDDRLRYREYPALKICRLAVCDQFQRHDIGTIIFNVVLGFVVEDMRPNIGIRFISVDGYPASEGFYKNLGFVRNVAKRERSKATISMRFDTTPIS